MCNILTCSGTGSRTDIWNRTRCGTASPTGGRGSAGPCAYRRAWGTNRHTTRDYDRVQRGLGPRPDIGWARLCDTRGQGPRRCSAGCVAIINRGHGRSNCEQNAWKKSKDRGELHFDVVLCRKEKYDFLRRSLRESTMRREILAGLFIQSAYVSLQSASDQCRRNTLLVLLLSCLRS